MASIEIGRTRPQWVPSLSVVVQWLIVAFTFVLVALPILPIAYQAFLDGPLYDKGTHLTVNNLVRLLADQGFRVAALNSLIYSTGATIVAQLVGVSVAVLAGRTNIYGKAILSSLVVWPMLVSDLVKAVGFSIMYGPTGYVTLLVQMLGLPAWDLNSMGGMILVGGICQAPITYLYCIAAARAMDPSLENAARSAGGSPATVLFKVTLPLLLPAFLASAFVSFIGNLETLSIPLIFGQPAGIMLFPTYLYSKSLQAVSQDDGLVGAAAMLVLLLLLLSVTLERRIIGDTRRYVTVGGKAGRQGVFPLGALRIPLSILLLAFLVAFVGLPIFGIFMSAFSEFFSPYVSYFDVFTFDNFVFLTRQWGYLSAFINSLIISSLGGGLAVLLSFLVAVVVARTHHPFARSLALVVTVPRAIGGLIAGLGFFYASVIFPPLGLTRGTIFILMIAFIMRHLPLGYGAVLPAVMQVSKDLDASARASGASWLRAQFAITFPIVKPALLSAFAIFFLHFFKEYSTGLFLIAPGMQIVGTVLLGLVVDGQTPHVAALAVVQVVVTATFLIAMGKIAKVRLYD